MKVEPCALNLYHPRNKYNTDMIILNKIFGIHVCCVQWHKHVRTETSFWYYTIDDAETLISVST